MLVVDAQGVLQDQEGLARTEAGLRLDDGGSVIPTDFFLLKMLELFNIENSEITIGMISYMLTGLRFELHHLKGITLS